MRVVTVGLQLKYHYMDMTFDTSIEYQMGRAEITQCYNLDVNPNNVFRMSKKKYHNGTISLYYALPC